MRIFTSCGCGVRALALTPPGEFGDSQFLRGFKPRFETVLRLGPVRIAGKCSHLWRRFMLLQLQQRFPFLYQDYQGLICYPFE